MAAKRVTHADLMVAITRLHDARVADVAAHAEAARVAVTLLDAERAKTDTPEGVTEHE
jgi:hypothetical protein